MFFLLLFQQLIASSTHLFAKHVIVSLHPAVVVLYRGFFSVIAYAAWLLLRRQGRPNIVRADIPLLLLMGLINIPMNQLMFVWGLKYTSPPDAALAYALSPAFVLIISHVLKHEFLTRTKVLGICCAIAGTLIVLLEKGLSLQADHLRGNIIELCASMSWAVFTVLGRRMSLKIGAVYSTGLSMAIGLVLFLPVYALLPVDHVVPSALTADQWVGVLYLGVVTSGLGFGLWYYLLTKMEASKVAVFNNLQPVLTTVLTFFMVGTLPSLLFCVGGCVVLLGVALTQRG
jgi:drug/metabolite transporter (DMT)-like permease